MKTIFAKYHRGRLPKFQIVTKIVEENGVRQAVKQPLSPIATHHIQAMQQNYTLLINEYPNILLCKPTLLENGMSFEMVEGKSLESLLEQALEDQDKEYFLKLLKFYIDYVESLVSHRQIKFTPCSRYKEVFGEWNIGGMQDVIDIANIDLIFSNLFLKNEKLTQIDYEWVFSFTVPVQLIYFRTLKEYLPRILKDYTLPLDVSSIYELFGINHQIWDEYTKSEESFYDYVFGSDRKYWLNL